jgi:hypothetical protein
MEIQQIGISPLNIQTVRINDIGASIREIPPVTEARFIGAPVTVQVGTPIINMPGCVTAHEKSDANKNVVEDDPKGAKVFCDGQTPSFNPIQYEPENLVIEKSAPVPNVPPPPDAPAPAAPEIPKKPVTAVVEEEPAPEPEIPWQEKYLPTPEAATTTAAIAVVATTSALLAKPLADLLLKVIKPVIKKVITKAQKLIGKKIPIESVKDRRDQQRVRSHAIRKLKGKE